MKYNIFLAILLIISFYVLYLILVTFHNKTPLPRIRYTTYNYSSSEPTMLEPLITRTPMLHGANTRTPMPRTLPAQFSMPRPSITRNPMPQVFIPRPSMPQLSVSLPPIPPPPNTRPI